MIDGAAMFDEIVEAAVEIAERHHMSIADTAAAERLISIVGSHITNKRRQEDFLNSTIRPNESDGL